MRTTIPGDDYLTNYGDWLDAQNARGNANLPNRYDQTLRYMKKIHPEVVEEYREKIRLLQKEKPLSGIAQSVTERMLADIYS